MSTLSDWSLVRSFLAVARTGSLSAAARRLALTQPTVGRHVAEMERHLGATLFTRSPGGLVPTEAARALVAHAEAMENAMAALERAAGAGGDREAPRGTVRITTSPAMGVEVLPEILAGLRASQPGIVLELLLGNQIDDILRREADIAVRMTRPTQTGLVARRIGTVALALYATRAHLERFGVPRDLAELRRAHLVGFDRDDLSARSVTAGKIEIDRQMFSFRCDSDVAQMAAIRAGLGIGVMQRAIAARHPDLVPVLADLLVFPLEVWLVVHEDQKDVPHVRATFDALAAGLSRHVER